MAHNHNPDVAAIEVSTLKAKLKKRAVVGDVQPAWLLAGALLNASDAAKDRIKIQTARRGIRRFKQGMVPPEPATRRQLNFVGPWTTTTGGDNPKTFVRHDSGSNARDRVVVFATDESLRALCRANTWFMDGNFSFLSATRVRAVVCDPCSARHNVHFVHIRLAAGEDRSRAHADVGGHQRCMHGARLQR